jgi:hypothetical protein
VLDDRGGLVAGIHTAIGQGDQRLSHVLRHVHAPLDKQAGDILRRVRDRILKIQNLQKIPAVDRHQQAFRQMRPNIVLDVVCFVFERKDLFLDLLDALLITFAQCLEDLGDLRGTALDHTHVFLHGLERGFGE